MKQLSAQSPQIFVVRWALFNKKAFMVGFNQNTAVVIPARNESSTVAKMVKRLKETTESVFVVNDASTDNTGQLAKDAGAYVINLTSRLGYSQALIRGFERVSQEGFSHAVTIDADAAHNPDELSNIVQGHIDSENSLTIGNRFYPEALLDMPSLKRWSNYFASRLINLVAATSLDDVGCGFRVFRIDLIEKVICSSLIDEYSLAFSSITLAKSQQLKIGSVPVSVYYDASSLLYSRQIELLNLVSVAYMAAKSDRLRNSLERLSQIFSSYQPVTVNIAHKVLCIHALSDYEGYIFQRQNMAYKERVVGEYIDFDQAL